MLPNRRPSALSLPYTNVPPSLPSLPSPSFSQSHSVHDPPAWDDSRPSTRIASPTRNHFTTLPPSPPRSGPPSPPSAPFLPKDAPWLGPTSSQQHQLDTPPQSAPNSARFPSAFELAMNRGVSVVKHGSRDFTLGSEEGSETSESVASSRDDSPALTAPAPYSRPINLLSVQDDSYRSKKHPSVVLTAVPAYSEGEGLALGLPADALPPALSPRLRRQYPTNSSLPPSPTIGHFVLNSTSPLPSPIIPSYTDTYLSPTLPTSSPILSSTTMTRQPSSPRLLSITEPLGKFAGMVRRASSSSLRAEQLPTSQSRSTSPARSPILSSSPTLSAGPLSPLLGSAPIRRGSFAAQAREKEKEKEEELREREKKAKRAPHNRMFSWAERPSDAVKKDLASRKGFKNPLLWVVLLVAAAGALYLQGGSSHPQSRSPPPARNFRQLQRRHPTNGASFIHPDVLNRQLPSSNSYFGVPWRWLHSFVTTTSSNSIPIDARRAFLPKTGTFASSKPASPSAVLESPKSNNVFVPARAVPYTTHDPLPPPPLHSDAPNRDTLVLYRILGNDLPPRHSPGQTLRNLRFLLQHESDFSTLPHLGPHPVHHSHAYGSGSKKMKTHSDGGGLRVDKYFVLNRISEPEVVSAIIGLLKMYSVPDSRILVIPFDWKAYETHDFRWDGGVDSLGDWGIGPLEAWSPHRRSSSTTMATDPSTDPADGPDGIEFPPPTTPDMSGEERKRKMDTLQRLRALDFTYHEKNLYAMNNNGGRNFALQHGRSLPNARWILPLDGNSFFTPAAMYSIVQTLSISGEGSTASRYLIIPMARLLSNDAVLSNNSIAQVPEHHDHSSSTASSEAEHHHRPNAAPDTPEEPQVGFRYDSTESYQEAMRYGRRSKLELLWRLGAITYSRGLDRRTLPWESSDREHVTAQTWGSIPGVAGLNVTSPVHLPNHNDDAAATSNFLHGLPEAPERGPLAFSVAGWVYRLFSGDEKQEQYNPESVSLRNRNRIKGITAFIERLDDRVARGKAECGETTGKCGFTPRRLWSFDGDDVDRLRQKFKLGVKDATAKVTAFEVEIFDVHSSVSKLFDKPAELAVVDVQAAAMNASLLAMAAYVTSNSSYSTLAADLITARFMRPMPMYYRSKQIRDQHQQPLGKVEEPSAVVMEFDGAGYGFPPPLTNELRDGLPWGITADHHITGAELPSLPFDSLEFDPTLLLDAIRLLQSPNAPRSDFSHASSATTVTNLFVSHLSYLLFAPKAIEFSRNPGSVDAGAHFDAKVAALAAFVDDARLFVRVANRARLRMEQEQRELGLLHDGKEVREIHWRLIQGVARTRLLPYSSASDAMSEATYGDLAWGLDSPFHLLEL